jgi:hypothetical protein
VIWPVSDWKTLGIPSTFSQAGLSATGNPAASAAVDAGPLAAGVLVLTPVAALRGRRRRKQRRGTYAA